MPRRRYQGHLRNLETVHYREYLRENLVPCHECGKRASIPDHEPPVSTFAHPSLWHGELLPHCETCSNKQGARQRWERAKTPANTRDW